MKRILVFILSLAIATLTIQVSGYNLNVVADYQGLTYGLLFNALLWLIVSIVLQRKYNERTKYKLFLEESLTQCKADLESVELVAENQAKEIDNYDKMFKQQKKKHLATINLGDKVTPTNRMQVSKVQQIRLHATDKDGNGRDIISKQYRLSATGKWYSFEQLRKVE